MKTNKTLAVTAFALLTMIALPSNTSALNINLDSESEVKINDKIESYMELRMNADARDNDKNNNDDDRNEKNKSEDRDNKSELKNDKKLSSWLKSFLKNDKKGLIDLKINGEHNSVATSSAKVMWKTNLDSTTGYIKFSTNKDLVVSSAKVSSAVSANSKHSVALSGLQPGTVYYYIIGSTDASGNIVEEKVRSFKTKMIKNLEVEGLKIMFSNTFDIDANDANVIWITNKPTTAKVWLSTSSTVDTSAAPLISSAQMSYFHNIEVSSLATSTTYYYVAGGTDASGNTVMTSSGSFKTGSR